MRRVAIRGIAGRHVRNSADVVEELLQRGLPPRVHGNGVPKISDLVAGNVTQLSMLQRCDVLMPELQEPGYDALNLQADNLFRSRVEPQAHMVVVTLVS